MEKLTPAQQERVQKNMGLAQKIAQSLAYNSSDIEEVCSVAYLGLIKAAQKFDPAHVRESERADDSKAFSGYARIRIRGEILDWFARNRMYTKGHMATYQEVVKAGYGSTHTAEQVAQKLGKSVTTVTTAINAIEMRSMVHANHLDDNDFMETLHSDADDSASGFYVAEAQRRAWNVMNSFPFEQQAVMSLVMYENRTIIDTSKRLNLPNSRVRRYLQEGLLKIHEEISLFLQDT